MRLDQTPPWIIRTYAGFGDAAQSNARFRENLARGQQGLSVAFDLPTQTGYDSDHPMAQGEVGGTGVAICHMGDMAQLFEGIDLGEINTSMTINATAPWLFALYVALADQRGVPRKQLKGTTQNDLLKEFVGRGTHIFAPTASLRLSTDLIAFATQESPAWNPINACGYHYMESGAGPAQEVGFALGNALMVLDALRPRLSDAAFADVVGRLSFFVNAGIELVPEIAKMRAYADLWPELCEREYGVPKVRFRAGCQVRSLTLTEQQPEVNIVRIAYQALIAVLSSKGRVRALQLPGFREAIALPDQGEQTLSLRTQQVLMYETGITDYGDLFEGNPIIARETASVTSAARDIAHHLREMGYDKAIDHISRELTSALVVQQTALERRETVRVGVNAFPDPVEVARPPQRTDDASRKQAGVRRQIELLAAFRAQRDAGTVAQARTQLADAVRAGSNIMEASIALARAGGTTGEWTDTLAEVLGGRFVAPLGADVSVAQHFEVPQAPRKVRVLLAKGGLDGHVNAVKLLAYACRQAGMEVIYTGLQQPAAAIAASAVQEDVDLIGISSLSGAHLHIAESLRKELAERGASDIPVVVGGIIPEDDVAPLLQLGVAAVFGPKDGNMGQIVERLIALARTRAT